MKIFKPLKMTCHANPQRFSVFGTVTLEEDIYNGLNDLITTKIRTKRSFKINSKNKI